MKSINEEMPLLKQLLSLISNHFGTSCEVVLHDLTQDYNHTIVDIRNGHITNRTVGLRFQSGAGGTQRQCH